jgi:beta-glucosidase
MPHVAARDLELIAQPIDVVGVNYYERRIVAHDDNGSLLKLRHIKTSDLPRTADREIYAPGLREVLDRLHQRYRVPRIVITENGAASQADEAVQDGGVRDPVRVEFLRQHLEQVVEARRDGVPVDGYFAWSLLDNFEWSEGYSLRYGIVHVDFTTQKRTPKDSAHFIRGLSRRTLRQ